MVIFATIAITVIVIITILIIKYNFNFLTRVNSLYFLHFESMNFLDFCQYQTILKGSCYSINNLQKT